MDIVLQKYHMHTCIPIKSLFTNIMQQYTGGRSSYVVNTFMICSQFIAVLRFFVTISHLLINLQECAPRMCSQNILELVVDVSPKTESINELSNEVR